MHIISKKALVECWNRHPDSKKPLSTWYEIASKAKWKNANEIKESLPNVSVLLNNRVVFNIKGNDYRLIVAFQFNQELGYICFVGTHAEYDEIDANKVWMF